MSDTNKHQIKLLIMKPLLVIFYLLTTVCVFSRPDLGRDLDPYADRTTLTEFAIAWIAIFVVGGLCYYFFGDD